MTKKNSKRLLSLLILFSATISCLGQSDSVTISDKILKKSSNLTPHLGVLSFYTPVNMKPSLGFSLSFGFKYKKRFLLAIAGNWIMFKHDNPVTATNYVYSYSGVYWELYTQPSKRSFFSFSTLIGKARMKYKNPIVYNGFRFWTKDGTPTIVIEPNIGYNIRLSPNLQFQARVAYHLSGGIGGTYVESSLFNGFKTGVGIFFTGLFSNDNASRLKGSPVK